MKIAAIDIGSNSIHMIIARVEGDGTIETIARSREMAKLGEETLSTGYLSEAVQERGLAALKRLKAIADAQNVTDIVAVATSATREARNGENFIARVLDETGIDARIISGVEEGRLIYLGAREVFPFGLQTAMIVDIGGGSVEFVIADQRRDYDIQSLKLGVRRLHELYTLAEPAEAGEVAALEKFIRSKLVPVTRAAQNHPFDVLIATSGTGGALARITTAMQSGKAGTSSERIPLKALDQTVKHLLTLNSAQLERVPELDDKRRETIVVGGVLLRTILQTLKADSYQFCDAALREGMIVDYLERNRPNLRLADEVPDPRRRSVLAVANRFYSSSTHPQFVARLAVRLFDELNDVLKLTPADRELLEYSALLHNVGNAISRVAHHKHSLYVIRNADLLGFSDRERLIMANVARYHRNSAPKSRHPDYMEMTPEDRELVKRLMILMRLANALDRGHRGNVHSLSARVVANRLEVRILANDDATLELNAAREHAEVVQTTLGYLLDVDVSTLKPRKL